MATYLPGAVGPPIYTKTCLYTLTPDRDFVVDRLPDMPGVAVALGAAHGFKFASVLGRVLAELSTTGSTQSAAEIARFRIDRPDPPRGRPGDLVDGLNGSGRTVCAMVCVGPGAVPPYRQSGRGGPP